MYGNLVVPLLYRRMVDNAVIGVCVCEVVTFVHPLGWLCFSWSRSRMSVVGIQMLQLSALG